MINDTTRAVGAATMMGVAVAPEAPAGSGVTMNVRVGSGAAFGGERTRQYVLTEIKASGTPGRGAVGGARLPVNLSLVLDRSGSMEGEPLDYMKRAVAQIVDLLTPNDVLSIITFAETVDVLMPARRVTDRDLIKSHVARILSGNTTNLFDGLYAGAAQLATVGSAGYTSRLLLLTDGEPTAGLKDFQSIVSQVGDLKAKGVTVSALGFGPEYNEELLAAIARKSDGNYYHIERPEMIPGVFQKELASVLGTVAKNPRLAFYLPRGSTVRQVYGSPPEFGARSAEIGLPDLESGTNITKIWEMDWEPRTPATYRVAKAVLSYEDAATGKREIVAANAVVDFVSNANAAKVSLDPQVAQEVAVAQASRDLEKTMMGMRTQAINVTQMADALRRTQTILTQQGRVAEASQVAEAASQAQRGDAANMDKTLMGAIYTLDQGRRAGK
ncbi:MAG: VWA domain-containing protein [Armatimonadetes bacterium]|nr:VWA domain-containing protein [Armatimonadota bacterium]